MHKLLKNRLRGLLGDNSGSTNMGRMIVIAITFVMGSILIIAIVAALAGHYADGMDGIIRGIMR